VPKRLVPLLCLPILLALSLSACGGGGGASTDAEGATAEIEQVVKDSAIQADPSSCTELNTQRFDEQLAHEEGQEAVKLCEQEAESNSPKASDVTVANVKIDGDKATLDAAMQGTIYDGQTIAVAMVKEGGKWKVDQITRLVKFDATKLEETFTERLGESGELTDEQISCVAGALGGASQKQAEEVLLSSSAQPLIELASGC
jgi:hypothetical protein